MLFDFGQHTMIPGFSPSHSISGASLLSERRNVYAWASAGSDDCLIDKRDVMVNRLLDWAEQARSHGRDNRSEDLTLLAWDAYERIA